MFEEIQKVEFTKEMKKDYTILVPSMLPIHFQLIVPILRDSGYHIEIAGGDTRQIVEEGLADVHNDICYPCLLVIGQMMAALKSGKYDPDKTALMITQTGGGCRASNYLSLMRKALRSIGYPQVPVISLNFSNLEKNSGFQFTVPMLVKAGEALLYGDLLMWIYNQCASHELHKGDSKKVLDQCVDKLTRQFQKNKYGGLKKNYRSILDAFARIPRDDAEKPKVGIVGEIYMKYSPLGNNHLEEFLIQEGAEPVVSGVMDFLLYCFTNRFVDRKLYGFKRLTDLPTKLGIQILYGFQNGIIHAVKEHGVFQAPTPFKHLITLVEGTISRGAKMGEGWLLTAEMLELIDSGVNNIVCTQPFGCLPNHIVAKGMTRKIKDRFPKANIVAIDYDPSATKINQENRLKLMLANARMEEKKASGVHQPEKQPSKIGEEILV